jgi:elongation factor 1-gamma
MTLQLYTYPGNFRAFKALVAAEYVGVDIDVPDFDMEKTAKTPSFLAMSPMGKVPVLKTPQGAIFESNAIARYVARLRKDSEIYGRTFYESALIDSWVDFCAHELELPCTMWVYPIIGYMPFNAAASAKAKEHVTDALDSLERHLVDKTYIVGDAITLADITLVSALVYPAKLAMDKLFRARFPNVFRWFDLCVHQPQFVAVIGDVALAESEMLPASASVGSSIDQGSKKGKKDKSNKGSDANISVENASRDKKEKLPKKEKAKVEQPTEPKPEKKKDHPLKILDKEEPSEFVGDVWKKVYSNNPPDVWKKQFWEMYDPKGWSLWACRFKYNHENEKQFMCANAIGGFVQRSDAVRKWAFGTMFVTGSEQDLPIEISGVWLMRGQSVEHLKDANDDALCYTWTKIDHTSQEMMDFVAEYWAADVDGYLEGKLVTDGKVFK